MFERQGLNLQRIAREIERREKQDPHVPAPEIAKYAIEKKLYDEAYAQAALYNTIVADVRKLFQTMDKPFKEEMGTAKGKYASIVVPNPATGKVQRTYINDLYMTGDEKLQAAQNSFKRAVYWVTDFNEKYEAAVQALGEKKVRANLPKDCQQLLNLQFEPEEEPACA